MVSSARIASSGSACSDVDRNGRRVSNFRTFHMLAYLTEVPVCSFSFCTSLSYVLQLCPHKNISTQPMIQIVQVAPSRVLETNRPRSMMVGTSLLSIGPARSLQLQAQLVKVRVSQPSPKVCAANGASKYRNCSSYDTSSSTEPKSTGVFRLKRQFVFGL